MHGIQKSGIPNHRYTYIGVEKEVNFDLNWHETDFRRYDAQLGRFHGIDVLAETMNNITPYHYSFNNPVMLNDPSGLMPENPLESEREHPGSAGPDGQFPSNNCLGCYGNDPPFWVKLSKNLGDFNPNVIKKGEKLMMKLDLDLQNVFSLFPPRKSNQQERNPINSQEDADKDKKLKRSFYREFIPKTNRLRGEAMDGLDDATRNSVIQGLRRAAETTTIRDKHGFEYRVVEFVIFGRTTNPPRGDEGEVPGTRTLVTVVPKRHRSDEVIFVNPGRNRSRWRSWGKTNMNDPNNPKSQWRILVYFQRTRNF